MNAARLLGEALANVFCGGNHLTHQVLDVCKSLFATVIGRSLCAGQVQTRCGGKFPDGAAVADWALDLTGARLLAEIIFGRKPSFEVMIMVAAEVIDFHESKREAIEYRY